MESHNGLAARAPFYCHTDQTWVVERVADIRTVLRDPRFGLLGQAPGDSAAAGAWGEQPTQWWDAQGATTLLNPSPALRGEFADRLREMLAAFEGVWEAAPETSHDLMTAVLRPWCQEVAARLLDLPLEVVVEAEPLTRRIFEAAAQLGVSEGPSVVACEDATRGLWNRLQSCRVAHQQGEGLEIQAWVALTQSLPVLIGAAVLRRAAGPLNQKCSHRTATPPLDTAVDPQAALYDVDGWDRALPSLLVEASPVCAIFRTALAEVTLGEARIAPGARVMLQVAAHGQFVFGDGAHRCVGGPLVRSLFVAALDRIGTSRVVADDPDSFPSLWQYGRAMRVLRRLPVRLRTAL